ncbi:MAG: alpha-glycosidase [Oerskovia sp.]|nr:alpha-glycosidase [Oerskovia sp.]
MKKATMLHLSFQPHHDGSDLYVPQTPTALGDQVPVRVRVPKPFGAPRSILVRVLNDHEARFIPLTPLKKAPREDPDAQWWEGVVAAENPVTAYRFLINAQDGTAWWLNGAGLERDEPVDALDFRLTSHPTAPQWAADQIVYQIFPDRFARSRRAEESSAPDWALTAGWTEPVIHKGPRTPLQLFGGDLDGITEHLDHVQALGATLIYLTPFFPARSNHRYDASTFDWVDPLLGGDGALVRLVRAAHERGLRVVGDLTTNHTGAQHEWFQRAYSAPGTPESDFYYWKNAAQTDYVAWYGVRSLPKLNWASSELRRRFIDGPDSIIARWLKPPYSLDGWRIDVANMTGRLGEDDFNMEIQRTIRGTMRQNAPDAVLYAESTNDAGPDLDGSGWHGMMSYAGFTRPLWHWLRGPHPVGEPEFGIPYEQPPRLTGNGFLASYQRFTAAYPWPIRLASFNALDTHDLPRFAERADLTAQRIGLGLSMTLPGTPMIFAGDEFGLRGEDGEHSRTPIPWGSEPVLAGAYRAAAQLRQSHPVLARGSLRWIHADDDALVFIREDASSRLLVLACRGPVQLELPGTHGRTAERLLGEASLVEGIASELKAGQASLTVWKLSA